MSLINEALKKAQRARQEGAVSPETGEPGGAVQRRPKPKSARSMILMGVAAVVLVVGSMIGTAIWLTRSPETAPVVTKNAAMPVTVASTDVPTSSPQVAAAPVESPAVTPIAISLPPAPPASTPSVDPAASAPAARPDETAAPAVTETASAPVAAAAPAPEPVADERVHKFVESVRVMGIRSSGNESKVLMNDRVYRVNDIVERTLGVKLVKVAPDSLTFTDANGAVYVKNF